MADVAHLWDLFRNIDSDKQQRVLRKWEAHVAAQRHDGAPALPRPSPALRALQVWRAAIGHIVWIGTLGWCLP